MSFEEVDFTNINILTTPIVNSYKSQVTIKEKKEDEICIILYMIDWCVYCKAFSEEWKKLEEKLKEIPNTTTKTCNIEKDYTNPGIKEYQIIGSPTIIIIINDITHKYTGERTADSILQYIEEYKSA